MGPTIFDHIFRRTGFGSDDVVPFVLDGFYAHGRFLGAISVEGKCGSHGVQVK